MTVAAPAPGGLHFDGTVRRGSFELDVAFSVAPGEVLGVLGPNGAGKTTVLRAVAGLELLGSGSISVGGQVWQDASTTLGPDERRAGVVFQDYRLFPHLDVRDNVAFSAWAARTGRPAARAAASQWLARLGLTPLERRRPHELSGGQAQRVALARALAREPEVLLLDEPMAALDAGARMDVRAFLREHLRDFAGPVVLVTHDPLEAMVMASRLLVVEEGRVVQVGTPGEVARHPASSYVARLVGLNLWAGRLEPGQPQVVTLNGGGRLAVSTGAPPGPVLVSLRPSSLTVHTQRPDRTSTRNVWEARVTSMELLADRVRLQVVGPPSALVDVTQAAVAELGLDTGSAVWVSAKATDTTTYPDRGTKEPHVDGAPPTS